MTTEIPDVRFWGMIVKSSDRAVYQIDNEQGLMEMCHLTNVALLSNATDKKPVYVRVKSPDSEEAFVIGALVPGQLYSMATDLIIPPDTQFMHTGPKGTEIHLTGYRSINAEELLLADEDDEDSEGDYDAADDDMDSDDVDEEDDEDVLSGEDGEADEEPQAAALAPIIQRNGKQDALFKPVSKRRVVPEQVASPARAKRVLDKEMSRRKIQARSLSELGITNPDSLIEDEERKDGKDDWDDDMQDMSGESSDGYGAAQVGGTAVAIAAAQRHASAVKNAKAAQREGGEAGEDDFEIGDLFAADPTDEEGEEDDSDEDENERGEGEEKVDNAKGKSVDHAASEKQVGQGRGRGVQDAAQLGLKQKSRDRDSAGQLPSADGVTPFKRVKVDSMGTDSIAEPKIKFPPHPEGTDEETRAYVETLAKFLKGHGGRFKMSVLGIECKRPPALKFGKILHMYPTWFKRSGAKGQEDMVLALK